MKIKISLLSVFLFFIFNGCNTYKKTYLSPDTEIILNENLPSDEPNEVLYLIGDAGDEDIVGNKENYLFQNLNLVLSAETRKSSIVFLGDNVYPSGLPSKKKNNREQAELILDEQLEIVKNYPGDTYFIPGNHDWNNAKKGGEKFVERQEHYVQNYFEKGETTVSFYPNNGCGDPVVKKISKDLYYVFIDSQWWLQDWENESKMNKGCSVKSRQEFLQQMEEIFHIHKNDQLVVFMHHPLYSNGEHGGNFSLKSHIFPLTDLNKNAWIPLPLIGSIVPINRSLGSSKQDIANPLYQTLKEELLGMLRLNKNVIFASGHEHSLQYFSEVNQHFIVSGAGSKVSFAKQGENAEMVRASIGYSKLYFYDNGEVWLDFLIVDKEHLEGEIIYRKKIVEAKAGTEEVPISYLPSEMLPDSISYAANEAFAAKGFKKFILGKQYRTTWTTPVQVEVLNFSNEKGGLFPVKKGGGMASNSLRVENELGEQYALRSIKKDYTKLFGPEFGDLKVINLMEDLNSASHPYAPLSLPTLSKAANIYYTVPKLVYLQRQEGLGNYNELFEEELYLLEDRPEGDRTDFDHLGNSSDIISYLDLLELKLEDNSIEIDEKWTLRSRLFDVWIHDWDRHDDQWRWAKIEENGKEFYRPIPRDRDQAFYKFEGALPWLVSTFGIRKFKTFKGDVKDVKYQSFNARYFDRYFLHELEWSDWEKQIKYLQENLSDEIIAEALTNLPPEVNALSAAEIESKLISRRENLMEIGRKLYEYLAKDVSVTGSNENELFDIKRKDDGSVKVKVYHLSHKGNKKDKIYDRTFEKNETDEIRLFGLGGQDEFNITGKTKKSIKIRVIGGFGNDKIEDKSKVSGLKKMTFVYDEKDGIKIKSGKELRDLTGPGIEENDYDREGHEYDTHMIMPNIGYTPDDNFWLGASLTSTLHGFRKHPYKAKHFLSLSYSPSSRNAFHFKYESDLNSVLFNYLDINVGAQLDNPYYINYFGLGNEIEKGDFNRKFNWVRLSQYQAHFHLQKKWLNDRFTVSGGPEYVSWSVNNVTGRVLDNTSLTPSPESFEAKHFLGGKFSFSTDSRDSKMFPKSGIFTTIEGSMFRNLQNKEQVNFLKVEQSMYLTFGNKFSTTFAFRTGWQRAGGNLEFYNYTSLGNNTYLRGFRNDRFRGNHIVYNNIDMRMKLIRWKNNILPMDIGILGGYDLGRVWLNNENSRQVHHGFTAGLWFDILNVVVLQPHFSISNEQKLYNFRIGFNF